MGKVAKILGVHFSKERRCNITYIVALFTNALKFTKIEKVDTKVMRQKYQPQNPQVITLIGDGEKTRMEAEFAKYKTGKTNKQLHNRRLLPLDRLLRDIKRAQRTA